MMKCKDRRLLYSASSVYTIAKESTLPFISHEIMYVCSNDGDRRDAEWKEAIDTSTTSPYSSI